MTEIPLTGCTPEPLMAYLKALGILRLISEQKDAGARGWWRNDVFWLRSSLDHDALVNFFLEKYEPTPIVAPWGARSGFYSGSSEKTARIALEEISASVTPRLAMFRQCIANVRVLLDQLGFTAKASDEEKIRLLRRCRNHFPDELVPWFDACVVLTGDSRRYPPLLGTGGNEGSGSYVSGFAQQVLECVLRRKHDEALEVSLFTGHARDVLGTQTPGHFSPTAAGGANGTQGFEASTNTNPWDYLLCIEGTCLWASAAVRRLGSPARGMAAFPFTVNVCGSGSTSLATSDGKKPKQAKRQIAEMWLPMWERHLSASEVCSILSEGRASVGGRQAETALDIARAASTLGVDRGIHRFARTAFLMRNGQSFLSIPLGAFEVTDRRDAELLRQIDYPWLETFRRATSDKTAPPRFFSILNHIDSAVFDFCKYGGNSFFQKVIVALGKAERALALTEGKVGQSKIKPNPLSGLSPDWIEAVEDGSVEFAVARALASVHDPEAKIGPSRANLEPVDWRKNCRAWAEKDRAVVWNAADLATNMANVLQRRMMDGQRTGCERLPLASRFTVSLDMVAAFIAGEIDEQRVEELIWGLMLINDRGRQRQDRRGANDPQIPRAYALLKLLFLPRPLVVERGAEGMLFTHLLRDNEHGGVVIRPEPSILHLLRGGRLGEACAIAMRRLRASGLHPMPGPIRGRRVRDDDWRELDRMGGAGIDPLRLAAALLIPICDDAVSRLVRLTIRGGEVENEQTQTVAAKNHEGGMPS
jgi:CRISPR-associated protein Csx17